MHNTSLLSPTPLGIAMDARILGRFFVCTTLTLNRSLVRCTIAVLLVGLLANQSNAEGEPARDFLKQLRAANYFDTAINYLNRLDQYPGVDPDLKSALELEKAQTLIEAAASSRTAKDVDRYMVDALASLEKFLKNPKHPRASEARMRLGTMQRFRGAQLLMGKADGDAALAEQKKKAREAYLASGKTFDAIIVDLKEKLTAMKGQKIDPAKEPKKAELREQYKYEYLEAQMNAAETRILAAETHADPAKAGKALLDESIKRFTEINEKYGAYPRGAQSVLFLGQANELLNQTDKAIAHYKEMVDQVEAEELRTTKFSAAARLIGVYMKQSPPKFEQGIKVGTPFVKGLRPNEKSLPDVQTLRLNLAKAYLAKSKDKENQKPADMKRAEREGRSLLNDASKVLGSHLDETKKLLEDMGISKDAPALPTAEPPKSLEDAVDSTRQILEAAQGMEQALAVLEPKKADAKVKAQIDQITAQIAESKSIGIQIIRGGLGMVTPNSDPTMATQARQYLVYLLYTQKRYRDSLVVGSFLARNSPGTEAGLKGAEIALNSLQNLIVEVPMDQNDGLLAQLEQMAGYVGKTWPDSELGPKIIGLQIKLMLMKDDQAGANQLLDQMKPGAEKATFQRLLGRLLWNQSIPLRNEKKTDEAAKVVSDAEVKLKEGLDGLPGKLVPAEAMQAALSLAKVYLEQSKIDEALATLDHPKYGPVKLITTLGPPNKAFSGDLYKTELRTLFSKMLTIKDPTALLNRAIKVMEKLRDAHPGPDGQKELARIYVDLAQDVRNQLDSAPPAEKTKLIKLFNVLLGRIAKTSKDTATLKWVGQTQMEMGESLITPGTVRATGQAAELIDSAAETFAGLRKDNVGITFLYAKAKRLTGKYSEAINELHGILKESPTMLAIQIEAALAYEQWAGGLKDVNIASKAYGAALKGNRPGANGKNVIWGWGQISAAISGKQKYRAEFFDARYHVAECRFLQGVKIKDKALQERAIKDITQVESQYPKMGGPEQRAKFDALLKRIQKTLGKAPVGLKPLQPKAAA